MWPSKTWLTRSAVRRPPRASDRIRRCRPRLRWRTACRFFLLGPEGVMRYQSKLSLLIRSTSPSWYRGVHSSAWSVMASSETTTPSRRALIVRTPQTAAKAAPTTSTPGVPSRRAMRDASMSRRHGAATATRCRQLLKRRRSGGAETSARWLTMCSCRVVAAVLMTALEHRPVGVAAQAGAPGHPRAWPRRHSECSGGPSSSDGGEALRCPATTPPRLPRQSRASTGPGARRGRSAALAPRVWLPGSARRWVAAATAGQGRR